MENYRQKLKTVTVFLAIGTVLLISVQVLAFAGIISPIEGGERWISFWNGFMAGASAGMCILFVVCIAKNIIALKSEKALKKQYVKDKDERCLAISEKSRAMGSSAFLLLMLPVSIVCGYFSIPVFFACIGCIALLAVITGGFKLYYSKKL